MTGSRLAAACALCVLALELAPLAGAAPRTPAPPDASARAVAVQLILPERNPILAGAAQAPPRSGAPSLPFAYPEDGSIVSIAAIAAAAAASPSTGTARAASEAVQVSLFGGEITIGRVKAAVRSTGETGDLADSGVTNLVALGQQVALSPNGRVPLGEWGYALFLGQSTQAGTESSPSFRGSFTGVVVHLDADHGGLQAGSEIWIGFAEAYGRARVEPPPPPTTQEESAQPPRESESPPAGSERKPPPPPPRTASPKPARTIPPVVVPPEIAPRLTVGRYVFPVHGPSAYGDTFRAPRADVSGGWHHGEDIFAPLGAPVLAVADGTVFSVGWNDVGGYRLWLRDRQGNEFYYAHLSAYTTLAVDGAQVRAGQVLGFVGNSGDAQGTPYHLHFEVHPVLLLFLGYDGAVNPRRYLNAWRRVEDVRILPAVGWTPPVAPTSRAPTPGAILLESTDISTASGLEPGALRRALAAPSADEFPAPRVGELPVPIPTLDRA